MKAFLFFSLFLISITGYSQKYQKLVIDGNKWNYLYERYLAKCGKSTNCYGGESKTYSLTISEDTIISEIKYNKVFCNIIRYNGTQIAYAGAIREDTINQIVYICLPNQSEEILYSFNVKIGDTISIDTSYYKDALTIRQVMSKTNYSFNGYTGKLITICDTLKRIPKSDKMPPYEIYTDEWYEGLGSFKGLFDLSQLGGDTNMDLLCFWNKENKIYSSPNYTICEYANYVDISEQYKEIVKVYPIPATNEIILESEQLIDKSELKDLTGKLVLATNLMNLDISMIHSGFYILTIYFKSGEHITKKVIKNAL